MRCNNFARVSLKYFVSLILIFSLMILSFVIASHIVTISNGDTNFSVNEDVVTVFNISLNNTNSAVTSNITRVDITIPSSFSFVSGSEGSDVGGSSFTNTTTLLRWTNSSVYLINASEVKHFWFNATPSTPGDYTFTVTSVNITGSYSTNLNVEVNDTTAPVITAPVNTSVNWMDGFGADFDATDNVAVNSWGVDDSTNFTINSSGFLTNNTVLASGNYTLNVSVNDSSGNLNYTLYNVEVSPFSLSGSLSSPSGGATISSSSTTLSYIINTNYNVGCVTYVWDSDGDEYQTGTVTGSYDKDRSLSLTGLDDATYTWNVKCYNASDSSDDLVWLSSGSNRSFTIDASTSTTSSSSSNDLDYVDVSFWTSTYSYNDENFNKKKSLNRLLREKYRVRIKYDNETHYIGVVELTDDSVTINVSSETQQAVLTLNDEKMFELNNDSYYDLSVKLNSIINNQANLTLESVHVKIDENDLFDESNSSIGSSDNDTVAVDGSGDSDNSGDNDGGGSLWWLWTLIIILVLAGGGAVGYYFYKKQNDEEIFSFNKKPEFGSRRKRKK